MKEVGVGALFVFVKPKSVEDMKAKAWEGCTMAVVLTSMAGQDRSKRLFWRFAVYDPIAQL